MNSHDQNEIIADKLSDYSCSDGELSDLGSEYSEDSDNFPLKEQHRTFDLHDSDSDLDENDSEMLENEIGWSEIDETPNLETFLGDPGVKILPSDFTNIAEVVKLFMDDDLFSFFVYESNKYHHQNVDNFKVGKKSLKWKDITVSEMKKFIGLILMMGKVRKDNRDDYWTTDPGYATPIYSQVMSRDRFRQIWQSWHFSDNLTNTGSGRLSKIQPVIDYFHSKFLNVYKPEQQLSVHESIIPWRGRLAFRVYNAEKIMKYGLLVRMVCESTSGYICNFRIYTAENYGLIDTIQTVLEPHYYLWHHIYLDNFFTSVTNTEILLKFGLRTCGTIRLNGGLPDCLKNVKLQKGDSIFRRKNQTLLQIWKSKKYIRMISNIHSAAFCGTYKVYRKTGQKVKKPSCIVDYDKFMKEADRADEYLSYYAVMKNTAKWTKRVVMFLINCALFNSCRVYNILNKKKIEYKKFIYMIGRQWALESVEIKEEQPVPSSSRLSADLRTHKLEKITTGTKTKYPTKKCRVCQAHKKRGETRYICGFCEVPLHKGDCFERYHSLIRY